MEESIRSDAEVMEDWGTRSQRSMSTSIDKDIQGKLKAWQGGMSLIFLHPTIRIFVSERSNKERRNE